MFRYLLCLSSDGCDFVVLASDFFFQCDIVTHKTELETRNILAGHYAVNARQLFGGAGIDTNDFRMRPTRVQDFAVQHLRQYHVVYVARLASGLVGRIGFCDTLADQGRFFDMGIDHFFVHGQ